MKTGVSVGLLMFALLLSSCVNQAMQAGKLISDVGGVGKEAPSGAKNVTDELAKKLELYTTPPSHLRKKSDLKRLFDKKTVTGKELIDELMAIKKASANADMSLMGVANKAIMQSLQEGKLDTNSLLKTGGKILFEATMNQLVTTINQKAMKAFMDSMIEDKSMLSNETITLPAADGLTVNQQQRILNIAAFIIGARVANRVADDALETLDTLENEYTALLQRREQYASVLADIVSRRREAIKAGEELAIRQRTAELRKYLSQEDVDFIDRFGADRSLAEFSNDFAMQNLAIRFLQGQDPQRYREYRAEADGLIGRTKVAVQTVGEAVAFGGLVASFANEVSTFISQFETTAGAVSGAAAIDELLPFGVEFVKTITPLAGKVAQLAFTGIALEADSWFGPDRFRVIAKGQEEDLSSSSKVFDLLEKNNEKNKFQDALFSSNGRGLLMGLYRCDPDTTGRMLDAAIPEETRNKFGVEYMKSAEDKDFSFVNALTTGEKRPLRKIVDNVLCRDQRSKATIPVIGEAQRKAVDNYTEWNNTQLTKMILANHHGAIEYAQMQVGDVMVQLIPSMTAVYEYESFADTLRKRK